MLLEVELELELADPDASECLGARYGPRGVARVVVREAGVEEEVVLARGILLVNGTKCWLTL